LNTKILHEGKGEGEGAGRGRKRGRGEERRGESIMRKKEVGGKGCD